MFLSQCLRVFASNVPDSFDSWFSAVSCLYLCKIYDWYFYKSHRSKGKVQRQIFAKLHPGFLPGVIRFEKKWPAYVESEYFCEFHVTVISSQSGNDWWFFLPINYYKLSNLILCKSFLCIIPSFSAFLYIN